jgi:hypothetical protein
MSVVVVGGVFVGGQFCIMRAVVPGLGGVGVSCDVAWRWVWVGADLVGIPLLRSPSVALCAPEPYGHLTSRLDEEGGLSHGCRVFRVDTCRYVPVVM